MNVLQVAVSAWCLGQKMPRMNKIDQICQFFNYKRSDLMESSSEKREQYYINDETKEIAQGIFENPDLRSLFDVAKDIPPERLKAHIEFMKSLKENQ